MDGDGVNSDAIPIDELALEMASRVLRGLPHEHRSGAWFLSVVGVADCLSQLRLQLVAVQDDFL